MPFARNGQLRLHFESTGAGTAVLLVGGLGMTVNAWWRTVPALARRFRVLRFDNRGQGRSTAAAFPYTVADMADDAVAVLDAAGEPRAHVYGISLGGMVAQEIALRHPDRVRALVLGATTPGGVNTPLDPDAVGFFARLVTMRHEEALWASVPYSYAERTRRRHAQRIAEDLARRLTEPPGLFAYSHQLAAAATHSTLARLDRIDAPTLVVHGEQDAVVPPTNATLLADAIPAAELELRPDSGHLYGTDDPRVDARIERFLLRHSPEITGRSAAVARARSRLERAAAAARRALRSVRRAPSRSRAG